MLPSASLTHDDARKLTRILGLAVPAVFHLVAPLCEFLLAKQLRPGSVLSGAQTDLSQSTGKCLQNYAGMSARPFLDCGESEEIGFASSPEYILATIGAHDDNIHQNQHHIVVPTRRLLSPEAGVPNKDFFLDSSQHE